MNPLLLQVFNRPWYINKSHAISYEWAVKALLDGSLAFEQERELLQPKMVDVDFSASDSEQPTQKRTGRVALIPIQGVLMQKDQECGPVGMETIGRFIKQADNDPSIDAIILDINSPGGSVAGTANLGKVIANTQKPIIGFVNELAASAAYWIASQTDKIIASDTHCEVGSIGVMLEIMDLQPYYESLGVKFHRIMSNHSALKNKDYKDIQEGKYDDYRKAKLDPLAEKFINTVKKARGKIGDEDLLKGEVVFADYAIANGLVDQVASFDDTVQIALEMADKNRKNAAQAQNNQTQISLMEKFPTIAAALGVESLEMSDGGSFLNEANLTALEGKLSGHKAEVDAITAERDQAKTELSAAVTAHAEELQSKENELATANALVAEKETQIANILKNGGEASASAQISAKKDIDSASGEKDPALAAFNSADSVKEQVKIIQDNYL